MILDTQTLRKGLAGAAVLVALFAFATLLSFATPADNAASSRSVEVGIATLGPAGGSGGFAIPASCPSYEHFPGECSTPPTASLSASPSSVTQGDSSTLSWSSSNATSCSGSGFSTGGAVSGSTLVSPLSSTTYTVTCSNAFGSTSDIETVTVSAKQPDFSVSPSTINEGDTLSISWQCYFSSSSAGGGPSPGPGQGFSTGGATSGSFALGGPEAPGDHQYSLSCDNGGFAQRTVTVREPTVFIDASPTLITPDETSTVSWSASGVNECTVEGPGISESAPPPDLAGGATWSDSGETPPLDAESIYRIRCETDVNVYTDQVIINVVPEAVEI